MKQIIFTASLLILGAVVSSSASARLLLEPHVGYESAGVLANKTATPTQNDGYRTMGATFGARLGYHLPVLFWFGGDIDYSTGNNTWADTTVNASSYKYTRTDYYAMVGVDLPVLLRGWVGYGVASNVLTDSSSNTYKASGTAVKGGVGIKILPFVNLTLEGILRTMTDYEAGGVKTSVSSTFSTYRDAAYRIGISVPL